MKETGVIRRVDELGRIVIPKEIRRHLRINVGDQLDIYTNDKSIVLKKFQPLDEINETLDKFIKSINKESKIKIVISDTTRVITSCATEYPIGLEFKDSFLTTIKKNETYELNSTFDLEVATGIKNNRNCYIKKVIANNEFFGFVMAVTEGFVSKSEKDMVNIVVSFIEQLMKNDI